LSTGGFPDSPVPDATPASSFGAGLSGFNPPEPAEDNAVVVTEHEDGGVTVELTTGGDDEDDGDDGFDANLAKRYAGQCPTIAANLLDAISADERSRSEWVEEYKAGLDLLGLKINDAAPGTSTQGGSIAGAFNSRVRHGILLEACLRAQAMERGELLPAAGPVKVRNDGDENPERDQLAADLEEDMNHWLTVTASEYYPDTDRMLFAKAFGGNAFKKVYYDPIRKRPVSESVELPDLIVSNDATDMANATRVTHQIMMTHVQYRAMVEAGVWIDTSIGLVPAGIPTPIQTTEAKIRGIQATPERQQDVPHTIYECYTYLDLEKTGGGTDSPDMDLDPLPYKVTIDKDTMTVLEIRRNWRPDDEMKRPRKRFVKYGFIPAMGFLDLGYLHILGQDAKALTAIERILIDAGMFSNFPGGIKVRSRNDPNNIMPGPGQFIDIDPGIGAKLSDVIMPLPYKGPMPELIQLWDMIQQNAKSKAATIDLEIGEGRTNMPVGTVMAMIEQQTQMMTSVHKRDHTSQQEEFILLRELFAEYPESLWQDNPNATRHWKKEELDDLSLVPASDPNIPAQTHRILMASGVAMLAQQNPGLYDQRATQEYLLETIRVGENTIQRLLLPPQPAPPPGQDPQSLMMQAQAAVVQAQVQNEQQKTQIQAQKAQADTAAKMAQIKADLQKHMADMADAAADRASRERIAEIQGRVQLLLAGIEALNNVPPDPVNSQFNGQQAQQPRTVQ
jgi:hypothetical protein